MALYMGCNRCRNLGNFRNNDNGMENIDVIRFVRGFHLIVKTSH